MNMSKKYVISKIHNLGVITHTKINKNELIDVGITFNFMIFPQITKYFGKWINHSYNPTARLLYHNNEYYVVANRDLNIGEEITVNYNTCPWYIQRAKSYYI